MDFKEFGSKLKELASSPLFDYIKNLFVPPKSIKEYYNIGSFSISKKLFKLIFYCLVIISVVYVVSVVPELMSQRMENFGSNKIYTKYYSSRALRSYSGLARVLSKKNDAIYSNIEKDIIETRNLEILLSFFVFFKLKINIIAPKPYIGQIGPYKNPLFTKCPNTI